MSARSSGCFSAAEAADVSGGQPSNRLRASLSDLLGAGTESYRGERMELTSYMVEKRDELVAGHGDDFALAVLLQHVTASADLRVMRAVAAYVIESEDAILAEIAGERRIASGEA